MWLFDGSMPHKSASASYLPASFPIRSSLPGGRHDAQSVYTTSDCGAQVRSRVYGVGLQEQGKHLVGITWLTSLLITSRASSLGWLHVTSMAIVSVLKYFTLYSANAADYTLGLVSSLRSIPRPDLSQNAFEGAARAWFHHVDVR